METKQKKILLVGLSIVLLFSSIFFAVRSFERAVTKELDPEKMQPTTASHEKYSNSKKEIKDEIVFDKEVSFCGKRYKTNGAVVNGVEVVQRIAEVASQNPDDYVCDNINRNETTDTLSARLTVDENGKDYYLRITSGHFLITDGKIFKLGGFDGEPSFYANLK